MARVDVVWSRLHLPRPLDLQAVLSVLLNLASDRQSPVLIFELRADHQGVAHLLGCERSAMHRVRRILTDQLPGTSVTTAPTRQPVSVVGRLRLSPRAMPLRTDNPVEVSRALLSAMAVRLRDNETQAIQIVLGRRQMPRFVQPEAPSPGNRWWSALVGATRAATSDERRQLRIRAEDTGFAAVLRVGTSSPNPDRARRLALALHSALHTARAPGVRMDFLREDKSRLNRLHLPRRWTLDLACAELAGLLGWPLGEDDLPGVPALHPRPLRPASAVHAGERVFATSATPGDKRRVGIAATDAVFHGLALGPVGSGKSTVLLHLIEADMKAGRPVAVLDPKRQLIDDVLARVPASRLDDVVVLDVADQPPVGFNPLDVRGRDPDVVVDGIMSVFGSLFTDGWGPRTLDIFSGTLRTLARASVNHDPATLLDIPRLLTDPAFRRTMTTQVADDEGLAGFWAWYESQSPQAQAAAIAAPLNKLRQLLLRPALVRVLDQRQARFGLRNIWRDNKILLVPLNEGLIGAGTASMLGSLIVADLWQAVQERASEKHPEQRPGMVYVDEAPRFLHLPHSLADALAISRSLGVGWFLAAQYRAQFGKEMRSGLDMNARSKIVFATEHKDAAHYAKATSALTSEDFTALHRFEAYANLVADGLPQGWALVRTLPPSKPSIKPERVIARSRARWGAQAPPEPPSTPESATGATQGAGAGRAAGAPVGRRRRRI